jgi:DNA (cytosine-5)-methyltransferase 1
MKSVNEKIKTSKPTMIELFAGVGGFRRALESHFETVFFNQFEPSTKQQHAFKCYIRHYPSSNPLANMDISQVVEKHMRELPKSFDLLVGGFPCQDYSVAKPLGRSKGIEGKKGVLWWEIYKIVKNRKPTYVLLENVDRLLKSPTTQKGRDFAIMLKTLGSLGYLVEWRVINAGEMGFPQRRIRVFILARKLSSIQDPPNSKNYLDFLTRTGLLAKAFPARDVLNHRKVDLFGSADFISDNFPSSQHSPFQNSGYYLKGNVYTAKVSFVPPESALNLGDVLETDSGLIPEEYWLSTADEKRWSEAKAPTKKQRVDKKTGFEFFYSEGQMPFPDPTDRPSRTIVTGEGGSSPSRFKHVVEQNGKKRRLTPIELEKLNGFPENWTRLDVDENPISDIKRAFFMGNALVIGVVSKIGRVIFDDYNSRK